MATTTDDIPQMDYAEHERTFNGFTTFTEIAVAHVLCIVVILAIWGVKHSSISWRPLAGVFALLLLTLAIL
jgi:hypothetical protein